MLNVPNKRCIRRLSDRSLKAAKTRNIIAVIAIALTTVLFTSLFTIAMSINDSFQQGNFRQAGGDNHGTFKDLTEAQVAELRDDPLIQESGTRLMVGMTSDDPPFNKSHIEVSYMDPTQAKHYFIEPVEGRLPAEGTDEAAADTRVLSLLGVEPKIGARFTLPIAIDGNTEDAHVVERTFTLCGWWEYDSAITASHVLLPRSAADELCALSTGNPYTATGTWSLDVMLASSLHIREDLTQILANHGYQCENAGEEDYIGIGVNWGYSGAQLAAQADPMTVIAIAAMLALIIFTGYLIIYNVFQISVTGDIRFYGLLKTIGTTGRQIRRMIRRQAYLLSLVGIPIGLAGGYFVGAGLVPVVISRLDGMHETVSLSPLIFVFATVFSLITVRISCRKPGKMAARVSPVEAVRYTDASAKKPKKATGRHTAAKRAAYGARLPRMAWMNLGRSRGKTVVTVLSLALAVVLMQLTYTFAIGFDMDKYLSSKSAVDFVVGDAAYFQTGAGFTSTDEAVPENVIADIGAQGGVTDAGRIYGKVSNVQEFVTEDWFRQSWGQWNSPETLDLMVADEERDENGLLADRVQLYGMEDFPLSKLEVLEGDLSALADPTANAVAAVYMSDDYGDAQEGSNWAKVGDKVRLRYVEELEYFYSDTGEIIPPEQVDAAYDSGRGISSRAKTYRDAEYTVVATVLVPHSLDYRYYGADEFVMGAEQFKRDTQTSSVMTYVFDVADGTDGSMEAFLKDYTENVQPLFDYESKATYQAEFDSFRTMFLTLGLALSLIIGLVGVLNFLNAVLTGIITRRHEFAVLQAIGMTGKQLKRMLMLEGLYYALLALALSLALSVTLGPLVGAGCSTVFWFFTYKFSILPLVLLLPVFAALGLLIPLATYRSTARLSVVERLRTDE
ncbi:ABC transporter permease [Agathobaculum massiliense]|uniref:ABC transporter permease n=1 Tax=Agathobaculum massiliense TaxID=3014267 RepID=UPI0018FED824|nr:ABC transporter permease [Agathobaculum massiliense]